MKLRQLVWCFICLSGFLLTTSCNSDDIEIPQDDTSMTDDDPMDDPMDNPDDPDPDSSTVEFFNRDLVANGYVLINDAAANAAFLMNKEGEVLHDFPLDGRLGNDVFLLPNGQVLAMLESEDPKIEIGGFGGKVQLLDNDGTIEWNFEYSSDDYILHHDAEMLPNGNVIVMVWERRTMEEAQQAGSNMQTEVFPEAIIEINPLNDEIVWSWYAWDHLIQDHDDSKDNFGDVAANPQLIDLNYVQQEDGDIMHANGIAYDPLNDLIYLSVNFFHEIWVIDHSTSTQEATSNSGGNFGKGGDLIYRFGNPEAYKNSMGERLFYNNHFPNLLKGEDLGKIMVFTNGTHIEQSTVYEFDLPDVLSLAPDTDNEPKVTWSFTHPDLYSGKVSGAVKLPNGNRLIAEGDFGVWEVTDNGEVVWQYSTPGFYWRAYHYEINAPEIVSLGL